MLKRSPKSKIVNVIAMVAGTIAVFIAINSLLTISSLAHAHGNRKTYFVLDHDLEKGARITERVVSRHEMFSGDAPKNAFVQNNSPIGKYARLSIPKGAILTSNMASNDVGSILEKDERIMFIPTKDKLDLSYSNRTDLLSVSPDGFSVDVLATNALILFDLRTHDDETNSEPGYFVEVTSDQARAITQALSQSDIRFALTLSSG